MCSWCTTIMCWIRKKNTNTGNANHFNNNKFSVLFVLVLALVGCRPNYAPYFISLEWLVVIQEVVHFNADITVYTFIYIVCVCVCVCVLQKASVSSV